jgi:hypothetical protein
LYFTKVQEVPEISQILYIIIKGECPWFCIESAIGHAHLKIVL